MPQFQDRKLSEYFWLSEVIKSDTAVRMGIDNTPPPEVVANLEAASKQMDAVRKLLDKAITPSSVYRCEALEKVLTQKDYAAWCGRRKLKQDHKSWALYFAGKSHPKGWSFDFTCVAFGTPQQIVEAIRKSDIKYDQLIMEGTWVHISFAPELRMMAMNASFAKDGTPSYELA